MNTELPVSFSLPFDVPNGWEAHFMTNVDRKQYKHYKYVVSTFDFMMFYDNQVKVVLCDIATDCDGREIPEYFSVWWLFNPTIVTDEQKEEIDELYELLVGIHKQVVAESPDRKVKPLHKKSYSPAADAFWAYSKLMKDRYA
ncbi:hypothetical protein E4H12_12885 [Candidatus Thorarchaeota archaeon]|nr:MAG: hypothetical protein E4H12_12885 [Candidatus Thorarchaeota archaeon]